MIKKDQNIYILLSCLLFITLVFLLPKAGFDYDTQCWKNWATHIHNKGIIQAYKVGMNYNPGFLYIMYIFGFIQGSEDAIARNIHMLKAFPLLFDFLSAFSIFILVKKENKYRYIFPFFLILNIGYLYNSVIWGQADSIHSALIIFSLIAAVKKKPTLSFLMFVLAISTKLQAIIFFPVILLVVINNTTSFSLKKSFIGIGIIALAQFLILAPFISAGDWQWIKHINQDSVDTYPFVSMNAFNMWYIFVHGQLNGVSDKIYFGAFTYKQWGSYLFMFFSAVVMLPLGLNLLLKIFRKQAFEKFKISTENILLISGLIGLVFFYFNTQMHERYIHPSMILFAFYAFLSGNYSLYIITSVAYLLNLEKVMRYFGMHNYNTLIFDPRFSAYLFLSVLIIGIYKLYSSSKPGEQFTEILKHNKVEIA